MSQPIISSEPLAPVDLARIHAEFLPLYQQIAAEAKALGNQAGMNTEYWALTVLMDHIMGALHAVSLLDQVRLSAVVA